VVQWLSKQGGLIKLRPDHKLSLVRDTTVATRVRMVRDIVENLERIAGEGRAG
jgi:transcription-repair coupling factor (superfamily II helicase)